MNLSEYYDDCIINTVWWIEYGRHLTYDETPAIALYLHDMLVMSARRLNGVQGLPEALGTIVDKTFPIFIIVTENELILVDARADKQVKTSEEINEITIHGVDALCERLGMNSAVLLTHAVPRSYLITLGINDESYIINAIQVKFHLGMKDTLRLWKEALYYEMKNRSPESGDDDKEPTH